MGKEGFDLRIVSYEHIHSIKPEDKKALIEAIDLRPNEKILDAFCGYAAIGQSCLEREPAIELWLNDESEVQLSRAKENVPEVQKNHFVLGSFPTVPFEHSFFDKIVIKMGLHEVSKPDQPRVAKKARDILKEKGMLVIWDIMLNEDTQVLFQDIIRKKDELAGFHRLAKERYFFREDEFLQTMKEAGFSKIQEFHVMTYRFSSIKRLEQELNNDRIRLKQLNEFIRKRFPDALRQRLHYEEKGEDTQFNVTKKIYIMEK